MSPAPSAGSGAQRFAVVGSGGQLGRALCALLGGRVVLAAGRDDLDVRNAAAVRRAVGESGAQVVVNAAAYNNVDEAEAEVELAMAVNATGPSHLAHACRETGALLVHVSTDYVFPGDRKRPYTEADPPRPLNAYGISKLAGEFLVAASGADHLLVRTSAVLGVGGSRAKGGSFVERVVGRAAAGERLRVVADQVFSPTSAPDLAAAIVRLVDAGGRGLFHASNDGECTWHELARAALEIRGLPAEVEAIRSDELAAPARRPPYSVLDNARYRALGLPPLRSWRAALADLLDRP